MIKKIQSKNKRFSGIVSLSAALLFVVQPVLAQTASSSGTTGLNQSGSFGISSDFDDDVKSGKDELDNDNEAQKLQEDVVDGEDSQAGEGDEHDNQQEVDVFGDIQNAEDNQGMNEDNKDINNSSIDEVDGGDNIDEQSQEIINRHQVQEEGEIENDHRDNERSFDHADGGDTRRGDSFNYNDNQLEESGTNQ